MSRFRLGWAGILVAATVVAGCSSSPSDSSADSVNRTLVGTFSTLKIADGFQVQVDRGASSKVEINVTGLSEDQIEAVIEDDILELRTKAGTVPAGAELSAHVVVAALVEVTATSGAQVSLQSGMALGSPDAAIDLTAGAKFSGEISGNVLDVQMQAGASAQVTGSARTASIVGAEASKFNGPKLVVADAKVNLSSGATAELTVNDTLDVALSSGAKFVYSGKAKITNKTVKTGASLQKAAG